jgi:hypothetical protein
MDEQEVKNNEPDNRTSVDPGNEPAFQIKVPGNITSDDRTQQG